MTKLRQEFSKDYEALVKRVFTYKENLAFVRFNE